MLTLPIKKKWFDMILSGEKKEEYREIKPYWFNRFKHKLNIYHYGWYGGTLSIEHGFGEVLFRNGYGSDKPTIKCKVEITEGFGKTEWGAEPNKLYYVLKILSVEKVDEK